MAGFVWCGGRVTTLFIGFRTGQYNDCAPFRQCATLEPCSHAFVPNDPNAYNDCLPFMDCGEFTKCLPYYDCACSSNSICGGALAEACPHKNSTTMSDCFMCVGSHQLELHAANCGQDDFAAYCK